MNCILVKGRTKETLNGEGYFYPLRLSVSSISGKEKIHSKIVVERINKSNKETITHVPFAAFDAKYFFYFSVS